MHNAFGKYGTWGGIYPYDSSRGSKWKNSKALSELSEREKVNELSYYEKIIAQSKPYDDSGDLISRKVIKRLIGDKSIPIKFEKEKRGDWHRSLGMTLGDIYTVIDNAPTVSPLYAKAYKCGYEAGKNERPKAISDYFVSYTKTCHYQGYSC